MTDNVNIISSDRNRIKGSRRAYTMSLAIFYSMWMTLYTMLNPKESCKTNLVPQGKGHMDVHYKTKSFYLVTSLPIHLKGRMTCCANYHFNENFLAVWGKRASSRRMAWNYLKWIDFDLSWSSY